MTAEIAILNRSAVALAADSAVTIGSERGQKIFNTVNKLFTLSKYQPVGVMIYGSAQVMGVPWETAIKAYRKRLGGRCFPHLENYADDFLSFLNGNRQLFPPDDQQQYFKALVSAFYHRVDEDIRDRVKKQIEKAGGIAMAQTRRIVQTEITKHFDELKALPKLPRFTERFAYRLVQKFSRLLKKLREQFFQQLPLSAADRMKLRTMSGWIFIKNNPRVQGSGLVVAGFGDKDIYPRLSEHMVDGVIENKLIHRPQRHVRIGVDTDASIIPFAQSEVVRSFIDGIDPGMEHLLNKFLKIS